MWRYIETKSFKLRMKVELTQLKDRITRSQTIKQTIDDNRVALLKSQLKHIVPYWQRCTIEENLL